MPGGLEGTEEQRGRQERGWLKAGSARGRKGEGGYDG